MSVIRHLQIDIWNADCVGSIDYYEFPAGIPQRNDFSDFIDDTFVDFIDDAFHIMVDGGEIWSYNSIPLHARMFVGEKVTT